MSTLERRRHELGVAIQAARDIADEMKRYPEREGELSERFGRAVNDVNRAKLAVDHAELETAQQMPILTRIPYEGSSTLGISSEVGPSLSAEARAAHPAAFELFIRHGRRAAEQLLQERGVGPEEINVLSVGNDTLGGFAVSEDFRGEVIRNLAGFAVVRRAGARTVSTSSNTTVFPALGKGVDPYAVDVNAGDSNWKGEGYVQGGAAPPIQNKPTWGQERIPINKWEPDAIEITLELLDDAYAPVQTILAEVMAEQRGLDEDVAFLKGNGGGKPQGILEAGATTRWSVGQTALGYVSVQLGHATVDVTARHYARYVGGAEYRDPARLGPTELPADVLAKATPKRPHHLAEGG